MRRPSSPFQVRLDFGHRSEDLLSGSDKTVTCRGTMEDFLNFHVLWNTDAGRGTL